MDVSVEGEGNRTAGEVYIEDRSVQTVHHHYYAEAAGRVPESQLQAEFHAHTGLWCPRCAREVLETLMLEHGFTAKDLAAAWKNDSVYWDARAHRLVVRTPLIEAVFGWGLVATCLGYFLSLVAPAMNAPNPVFGASLALGGAIYLSACWMAFRFVLWPRRVALRVRRVMELEGVRCQSCDSLS